MLAVIFGRLYETIFDSAERHVGVVLLMSGTAIRQDKSWQEIANRYDITVSVHLMAIDDRIRNNVEWIVGFGARELQMRKVNFWMQKFIELVFLRETVEEADRGHFMDSIHQAMCSQELLGYTSVITIHSAQPLGEAEVKELTVSTQFAMWGMAMPSCPECGNGNVRAVIHSGRKKKNDSQAFVTLRCNGCKRSTKGRGIQCPLDVIQVKGGNGDLTRYCWKPLDATSPWGAHKWVCLFLF